MTGSLHNQLVMRLHDRALERAVREHASGRLVDIGCGVKPYGDLVAPHVTEHVGVDLEGGLHGSSNVDLFGTAYEIPSEDAQFDTALCTAVLEHLEEPQEALRECFRVLRPGGRAIYTVPFIWHLHEEPRDFYRFSRYGLRYQFEKAGFEILELNALSGFWVTFGQLMVYNLYRLNVGPLRYIPVIPALGLLIQGVSWGLDRIDRTEQWTWMYLVVAGKPLTPGASPAGADDRSLPR